MVVSDLSAALFNQKLLFAAAINIVGNAIASVNKFADERHEKRRLRKAFRRLSEEGKTLCLQLATRMEINEEKPTISCCKTPPPLLEMCNKQEITGELTFTSFNQTPSNLDPFWRLNVIQD